MISYELAKKLKEAGFPQESDFSFYDHHGEPLETHVEMAHGLPYLCSAPTLSELIEACGDNNFALRFQRGAGWDAVSEKTHSHGYSPEEAVALLWIALNKKI